MAEGRTIHCEPTRIQQPLRSSPRDQRRPVTGNHGRTVARCTATMFTSGFGFARQTFATHGLADTGTPAMESRSGQVAHGWKMALTARDIRENALPAMRGPPLVSRLAGDQSEQASRPPARLVQFLGLGFARRLLQLSIGLVQPQQRLGVRHEAAQIIG